QTGYCADTGGGWSQALVAHDSQLHPVPDWMNDEAAVMVEPTACAVHAAASAAGHDSAVVLGAGTLGLCATAALAAAGAEVLAAAKHPEQRALAADLGAATVVEPGGLARAVRRSARPATCVLDCAGTEASLAQAVDVCAPGGTVVLV